MLIEYLNQIADFKDDVKQYIIDLNDFLNKITSDDRILATHAFCTDGFVSGAMMRYKYPDAKIVPIEYWYLNFANNRETFANLNWYGIVDLEPFNNYTMNFWVDHHQSSVDKFPNAKRIRFDVDGDSGAYQLFLSKFVDPVPEYMVDLVLMTRITDTANFTIEAPTLQISNLDQLAFEPTGDKKQDLMNYEQRVWLLNDISGVVTTFKEHQKIYTGFAKEGFLYVENYLNKINELRENRHFSYEIADSIETTDFIVVALDEDSLDIYSLRMRLLQRMKVVISLSRYPGGIKISLRRSKKISKNEEEKIQLNQIASKLNGGGHAGASGAHMDSIEQTLPILEKYAESLGYDFKFIDLNELK
jgi:oligoribonuclease NrnB/cAMP/cGMP phosphodiesterase (DHH superfamily)